MPGRFLQVPAGIEGYEKYYQGTLSPNEWENTILWRFDWNYQRRSPQACYLHGWSFDGPDFWWPNRSGGAQDPASPTWMGRQDLGGCDPGNFEPWNYGPGGSQSCKYILGRCLDQGSNPVGGATIDAFRTIDDFHAGGAVSNDQGYFEVACPYTPTDQHYLVAYYASGNKAGVSVNTLVPTWRDGTT